MTAYADLPLAVQAIKLRAFDFVTKPWDNARLVATCREALTGRAGCQRARARRNTRTPCPPARSPRKSALR